MGKTNIITYVSQQLLRDGIRLLIENENGFMLSGEAQDKESLFEMCKTQHKGIVILDLDFPDNEPVGLIEEIKARAEGWDILALSNRNSRQRITRLIKAGAKGFLLKYSDSTEFIQALDSLLKGKPYICNEATHELVLQDTGGGQEIPATESDNKLTGRETEILKLICREYTNREIADKLDISVRTVDAHRRNILQKTGSKNTAGLVKYAIRHRLYTL